MGDCPLPVSERRSEGDAAAVWSQPGALIRGANAIRLAEPFECLAPLIVCDVVRVSRELAARVYFLSNGHIVCEGTPDALRGDPALMKAHLGI